MGGNFPLGARARRPCCRPRAPGALHLAGDSILAGRDAGTLGVSSRSRETTTTEQVSANMAGSSDSGPSGRLRE